MFRLIACLIGVGVCAGVPASAKDVIKSLQPAVAAYAQDLDAEYKASRLGHVVASENFAMLTDGPGDLNGDGHAEHIVYKCMFGCSEKPAAFTGTGTPCPFGNLLLSGNGAYAKLFVPGVVSKVYATNPVVVAITRPRTLRLHGNYCESPQINYDPQFLYELRDSRFQLVTMCPETGCEWPLGVSTPALVQ